MLEYYDQRASEYDEVYTLGTVPKSSWNPVLLLNESSTLADLIAKYCRGKLIDIPAGVGYWLQFYARNCPSITMVDQSQNMLIQSKKMVRKCGAEEKTDFLCTDILTHRFSKDDYDNALIGFFLSHLTDDQINDFFQILRLILKPNGQFLILDSTWSQKRKTRKNAKKQGSQQRTLKDGREFDIYKRYFEEKDFMNMQCKYQTKITLLHEGQVYIAAIGSFK